MILCRRISLMSQVSSDQQCHLRRIGGPGILSISYRWVDQQNFSQNIRRKKNILHTSTHIMLGLLSSFVLTSIEPPSPPQPPFLPSPPATPVCSDLGAIVPVVGSVLTLPCLRIMGAALNGAFVGMDSNDLSLLCTTCPCFWKSMMLCGMNIYICLTADRLTPHH